MHSEFSKLIHPVVFAADTSFLTSHVRLSSSSLPHTPSELPSSSTYSARSTTFQWTAEATGSYVLNNGGITLVECRFLDCTETCFTLTNTTLQVTGGAVSNCAVFAAMTDTTRSSSMDEVQFTESAITLSQSRLTMDRCTFGASTTVATAVLGLTKGSYLALTDCTFSKDGAATILSMAESSTAIMTSCNVQQKKGTTDLISVSNSYLVVDDCCFFEKQENAITVTANGKVALDNRANDFDKSTCPYVEPSATLSDQKRAFAITTVAVFFAFFTILFIVLIVYVACKAGADKAQQYGELHPPSEEGSDDGVIPSD